MVLAGVLGLEPEQVRVIAPDVGGGFGAKMLNAEELLLAWLARKLGRPVRWTETRSESMVALPHGRAQRLDVHDRRDEATARCSPTGSTRCRTPAPTRRSGRSCRT